MILCIRTDSPKATLEVRNDKESIARYEWEAGRMLAKDLLKECDFLLKSSKLEWSDLSGIIVYRGPGSFTGLRIGIATALSMAYALRIPVVGAVTDQWIGHGEERLQHGEFDEFVEPLYGAEPNITTARK